MRLRTRFAFEDEGEIIALFGEARLVKFLNGKYELRGGSKEDRLAGEGVDFHLRSRNRGAGGLKGEEHRRRGIYQTADVRCH
jgi:hypothetical protein